MSIHIDLTHAGIRAEEIQARRPAAQEALSRLWSGDLDFTGWVQAPHTFDDAQVQQLIDHAKEICAKSDVLVVLGVGGSFLGAKAVINLLQPEEPQTQVLFAGYNFSGRYLRQILRGIQGKEVSLCVISKSGTTTETLSAYGVLKAWMLEKYGKEETADRTYVVTESRSNFLFDRATQEGCHLFDLPVNIGGRYSVLSPVGLLPIAVAGIDVLAMMAGARIMASREAFAGDGLDYAIVRQAQYGKGKAMEIFAFFDPYLASFGEWLKQLFGETEGKDGKGIFPTSLFFSRDLHAMGQFLQQGDQRFFETFVTVRQRPEDVTIPDLAVPPFAGKTLEEINGCAMAGVVEAHSKAGIPIIRMELDTLDAAAMGQLLYFFETQCAVSALLSGVDPFNQPGVEDYKRAMRGYLDRL